MKKALILAAGLGNRLDKLTTNLPKALVKVADKLLIDHTLSFVSHPAITKIGVVGGYCFEQLKAHLTSPSIKIFENPNYKDGNIRTLLSALNFFDDDTLILNVDHIYPKRLMEHIINNAKGICAMCDFDRHLATDDMKVKLNSAKKLTKISKQLTDFDGGYIGMTFVSKDMCEIYKRGAQEAFELYGKDSCVEFILGHLASNDVAINICDTSGFRWLEIDTPEELKDAEEKLQ